MQYPKSLSGLACVLALLVSGSVLAEEETQPGTLLKPAKERGAVPQSSPETMASGTTSQRAYSVCLADWDAATHMTKQEWRKACERSVKDYPDAFRQ